MVLRFFEETALDWILVLLRPNKYFPYSNSFSYSELENIKARLGGVDQDSLDQIIKLLKERFNDEEKRRDQIESKARALQGFTALAGSFIVGFAQFLIGSASLNSMIRIPVIIVYVCIALSLLMTVTLAQRAVSTTKFVRPTMPEWLSLRDWNKEIITKQHVVDLYASILHNTDTNNDKGTFLNGAQDWMRNVIWFLAGFIFILVAAIANSQSPGKSEPIDVLVVTPTPTVTPSATFTSTPTVTLAPTSTRTQVPTINVTSTP